MSINNNDLLKFEELKSFCFSQLPNEKSSTLCKHLKKYMLIKNKKLFVLQPNITYLYFEDDKSKIIQYCTLYAELSFKNIKRAALSSDDDDIIEKFEDFQKKLNDSKTANCFSNAFYEKILPQIKNDLLNEKIVFDINLDEIHFENGFMNCKTKEFKPRDSAVHFITCCINRN